MCGGGRNKRAGGNLTPPRPPRARVAMCSVSKSITPACAAATRPIIITDVRACVSARLPNACVCAWLQHADRRIYRECRRGGQRPIGTCCCAAAFRLPLLLPLLLWCAAAGMRFRGPNKESSRSFSTFVRNEDVTREMKCETVLLTLLLLLLSLLMRS